MNVIIFALALACGDMTSFTGSRRITPTMLAVPQAEARR